MLSSDQILEQLKDDPRSPQLWAQLYDVLEPTLHRYASDLLRRMRTDPAYADDVVQDVLLGFVQDFTRITSQISSFLHLENYLIKACRNRILEHHRMTQVRASKDEVLRLKFEDLVSESFVRQFQQVENRQFVEQLLKQLGPRCEQLVRSFLLSNQTLTEYATENDIKIGTIYTQWQRCIEELKKIVLPDVRKMPPEQ
jgi:RNA polymerase sigma factor (sigma-70 family)